MGSKSNGEGLFGLVVAGVSAAIALIVKNKKGKNSSQQSQS